MAKVMEPLPREAGAGQPGMKIAEHVPSHQRPALMRREHVALVNPPWPGREPFLELATPMLS